MSTLTRLSNNRGWLLEKLGELVAPHEVVRNGNRKLHAVGKGAYYRGREGALALEILDAPLVAVDEPALLDFNNRQPALQRGLHFLLYNNLWGTNFPMWFEDDSRFRFWLRFSDVSVIT